MTANAFEFLKKARLFQTRVSKCHFFFAWYSFKEKLNKCMNLSFVNEERKLLVGFTV